MNEDARGVRIKAGDLVAVIPGHGITETEIGRVVDTFDDKVQIDIRMAVASDGRKRILDYRLNVADHRVLILK